MFNIDKQTLSDLNAISWNNSSHNATKYMKYSLFLFFIGLVVSNQVSAQHLIRGQVADPEGKGVEKVNVRLLNTNAATSTDKDGRFMLKHVDNDRHTIRITAVGYATVNYPVHVYGDTTIRIQIEERRNRLDEAIVTAEKKESTPQDIPASISVITSDDVERQYLWNIMDITALVPNLNMANPGDNRNVTSVRGITTTSYDQAVATYIDGVNQFGLDTYIPYLQDIERIEVLRGPQGTLYGRNAMGGVINIITRKPTNRTEGFIEATIGNYAQQRYTIGARTPLLQDRLFFGASLMFNGSDGFYTNEFDGSPYDKQHTVSGNYFLKYLPNARWTFDLNFKHVSNRNNGAFALIMGLDDAFEDPFTVNQNAKTTMVDESRNVSLAIHHAGQAFQFRSQTAFQSNYRYYQSPIDGDFSPMDAISIVNNYGKDWNRVNVWTQEFKWSPARSPDSRLDWTTGAYLFYQDAPTRQGTYFGADAAMMGEGTPTHATSILTNSMTSQGAALYGQLTYRLGEHWDIRGGIRYDHEWVRLRARGEFQPDGGELMVTQPDTTASTDFHALTPSASLSYHIDGHRLLYISYARGSRSGGISELSSDPGDASLHVFAPEFSHNFELGSKNKLWDQKLEINATAFYTRLTDVQVPVLLLPDAITVTRNTGRVRSMGLELEVRGRIAQNVTAWGNAGLTHAKYLDVNAVHDGENVQLKGNRPIFTPAWTGAVGVQYDLPIDPMVGKGFQVNVYGKYIGEQYFNIENTLGQTTYGLLNTSLGYVTKGYEFLLWGQNMTDTRYVDYAYDFGFAAVHLGRPATYGVTLRKRFGSI